MWYPNEDEKMAYYGIVIRRNSVSLTYFNAVNHEDDYILNLATEQFVNNKITGAINSNY